MTRLLLGQRRRRSHHRPKRRVMAKGAATELPHPQQRRELVHRQLERQDQECAISTPKVNARTETNVITTMFQNVDITKLVRAQKAMIAFGTILARLLLPLQSSRQQKQQRLNRKLSEEQLLLKHRLRRRAIWHWPCAHSSLSAAHQEQKH